MNFEIPLSLIVSLILALAIFSQWFASILKWPAIVVMARAKREHLIFHESNHFIEQLALICVSMVFVLITASLTTDMLRSILSWQVSLFVILMIFVIRPLAIFISTVNTEISFKSKTHDLNLNDEGIIGVIKQ